MSKELEEIKSIVAIHFAALGFLNPIENEQILKDRDRVLNALNELQSIKESNPSEALECLEWISHELKIYYEHLYIIQRDTKKELTLKRKKVNEYLKTIKQVLLKAQEPKQYLKWEDLVFTKERQEIPVRMGETIYILVLRETDDGTKIAKLLSPKRNYMGEWGDMFHKEAKQFFNDLHLERVEE